MVFISFPVEEIIIPCSYCALFVPPDLLHTHYNNTEKKKTWRIQEALKAPWTKVLQTFQRSLFWKLLLKKTTETTNLAENALYKSDNIPRKL